MIRNFLLTAIRNFKKARLISLINILGLSLGLAAFLLLTMCVKFERSYDRFQPDTERIYRLRYERTDQAGQSVRFASCCPPAGATFRLDRKMDFMVAGVFADIRPDSHLKFDILLSYPDIHRLYGKEIENSWGDSGWQVWWDAGGIRRVGTDDNKNYQIVNETAARWLGFSSPREAIGQPLVSAVARPDRRRRGPEHLGLCS